MTLEITGWFIPITLILVFLGLWKFFELLAMVI